MTEAQLVQSLFDETWVKRVSNPRIVTENTFDSVKEELDVTWKRVYFIEVVGDAAKFRNHSYYVTTINETEFAFWKDAAPVQTIGVEA
jgi:hypothetical protein